MSHERHRIAPSRLEDIAALQEIERLAAERFRSMDVIHEQALADVRERAEHARSIESDLSYTAWIRERPVGFVIGESRSRDAHLVEIDVLPQFGRRGIGADLVKRFCEEARLFGFASVVLSTFRDVPWNGPFYAALGFAELRPEDLEDWQIEELDKQALVLDVSRRCFMRFDFGSAPSPSSRVALR